MRNGRVLWRRNIRHGKMAASPAVVGDDLVVHGMDGVVRVLDRHTGRRRFAFDVGSPIESSPLVRDRIDYFGARNGNVYALDLRMRKLRWVYGSGWKITSSAAIADRTLYIGHYAGRLLALTPGTDGCAGRPASTGGSTDARGLGRPRIRALLGRRLADRLLDARPLPLADQHRRLRLFPHRPSGRSRLLGPTADGCMAPPRARNIRWSVPTGARSRARRPSSTASPMRAASPTGSSAWTETGRVLLRFRTAVRARLRERRSATPARLFACTAVEPSQSSQITRSVTAAR
jgi:hypothetical protein